MTPSASGSWSACTTFDPTFQTLPIQTTNALGQPSTTGYGATPASTGGFGLWPTAYTDANGQTTNVAYDGLGRVSSLSLPGEAAAYTKQWGYTVAGACATSDVTTPCVELDETQRLDSATTVLTRSFYDGLGHLVETRRSGPGGNDVVAFSQYDTSGRLVLESNSYFVPAYTGTGSTFATPDTTQPHTTTSYDGLGRVKTVTDPLGHVTTTSYSIQSGTFGAHGGNTDEVTSVVDANGHQTATWTDPFGRVNVVRRSTGNSLATYNLYVQNTYWYTYQGTLSNIQQADMTGQTAIPTTFGYDLAGRKTSMSDPDRGTETYSYDADGNLITATDGRGMGAGGTVYAGYDGLDRLLWRNTSNSPTGAFVSDTYDQAGHGSGVGRLSTESFSGGPNGTLSGSYSYTYDTRGRQTGQTTTVNGTGGGTFTTAKTYDDASDVLTQTYPDGEVVSNGFTAQSWLTQVTTTAAGGGATTTLASNIAYAGTAGAAGLITSMGLGVVAGTATYTYSASYDANHRLTAASLALPGGSTLFSTQPSYDAVGNVTAVATTFAAGTDNQAFCYDEQNRLTWASSATGTPPCGGTLTAGTLTAAQYTQSFAYDLYGRLASGPLGSYAYGDSAHAHAATAIGSGYTATYDGAGNLTCRAPTASAGACTSTSQTGAQLGWDAEGQLTSWQNVPSSPSTTDAFLYDGEGQRVEQQVTSGLPASPSTTTTVYLGNIAEVQTAGTAVTTTTYYYAGTQRIALGVNGTFSYAGSDLLGSASVALDASGHVAAAQLYAPYGTTRYSSGTMPGSYGFTGQRSDAAVTGLDYYGARYYDPAAGQFTSADSVLPSAGYDPWSLSRYAYVAGNPETHVDADGHCWPLCTMIVGALIGAAVSAASSVVTQAASGQGVDWGQVGKEAAVGVVAGAVSGLAGPEAGPLVRAAVDTGASVASQVASNALDGKPLGDGVGMAALSGAMASVGLGAVVEAGGAGVARLLGRGVEDAEGEAATVAHDVEGDVSKGDVCGLSFAANTPVTLADGSGTRAIAALKTGDTVLAYDPTTSTASPQPVEHVFINHDANLVDVTLVTDDASRTPATPAASESKARDAAVAARGTRAPPSGADVAQRAETIHTTTNHPWLTADHGWLPAGFLQVGERVVRADGTMATVAAVRAVPGVAAMYDLTVGMVHTFVVGDGRYVVHNCNPSKLNDNLGGTTGDDMQAHHVIPCECEGHGLLSLGSSTWEQDGSRNGILLASDKSLAVANNTVMHNGPHGRYTEYIQGLLDHELTHLPPGFTPADADAAINRVLDSGRGFLRMVGDFSPGIRLS